ncbi:phosphatidylglycerophosphatase PgpB [Pontibacter rugosus]
MLGLALLICLLLFLFMAYIVFAVPNSALDDALFSFADQLASPAMTKAMFILTFFASAEYLFIAPPLVVLVFCFFRHLRWHGLQVLLVALSTSILNQLMKRFFERPRPSFAMLQQAGLSFPSGHAMIGGAFYGVLIYVVWRTVHQQVWRWLLVFSLSLLILLIGFSRIYLKVHYATDVLAGFAMGFLWLMIFLRLMRQFEETYNAKFGQLPN